MLRRSRHLLIAVTIVMIVLAADFMAHLPLCAAQQAAAKKAEAVKKQGKQAFEARCAMCHGLDGRGGEHAPGIANNPRVQSRKDSELARIIRVGIPDKGMPSFHFLTNEQIDEMVKYIRALSGESRLANLKGDPAAGARLFFGEARCADCHMMNGKGGFIASDLSEYGRTHTPEEIRQVILEPNKVLVPRWQVVKIATRSGQQISGLVRDEDNFSIALLSEDGTFHLIMKSEIAQITREPRSIMPDDYGRKLNSKQLDDLASYLVLGLSHKNPLAGGKGERPSN